MSNQPNERSPAEQEAETATPGAIGALDGAAAAGSQGGQSSSSEEAAMPTGAPDPSVGPD
jgi:hypothetical protein